MNHENSGASSSSPEQSEAAQSDAELFDRYTAHANYLLANHNARFADIAPEHEQAFITEAQRPGTGDVDIAMQTTEARVSVAVLPIVDSVTQMTNRAAGQFRSKLPSRDQELLTTIEAVSSLHGRGSLSVDRHFAKASSPLAQKIMKASLDAQLLQQIQATALTFGPESLSVDRLLDQASSLNMRAAMKALLDAQLFARIKEYAKTFGAESLSVTRLVDAASLATVRKAMKASLDSQILSGAAERATMFGKDSLSVSRVLNGASSPNVRAVFARRIGLTEQPKPGSGNARTGTRSNLFGNGSSLFGDSFFENLAGSMFGTQTRTNPRQPGGQQRTEQHRQDTGQRPTQPTPESKPAPEPTINVAARIAEMRAQGTSDTKIKITLLREYHPDRSDGGNPAAAAAVSAFFHRKQEFLGK